MKLIFITREGYNLSGARVRCYNFAQELSKLGINTEILSFADNLGARYGEREFEMSSIEKIKYNIKAFKILLRKEKKSIFFVQRLNYHTMAPFLASLLKGNRLIFDCDDWNIRENPVYYMRIMPSSKMEFLTRQFAKYARVCIAASRFLKDYLFKFNKDIYYIPTGVDTGTFMPKNRNNNPKITFSWIGTVYHKEMWENIQFILECFLTLSDKYDNIFLNLAGEGRYFQKINNYVNNLRHKNRIIVNGWIAPDKIPAFLSEIDIGLLPLIQETKFNKAKSPTKLFEYMAMAKPTVSSAIGESEHIVRDGQDGFLVKSRKEFIEKMKRLIDDHDLRKKMGEKARITIENHYSLKILGNQLYEILSQLNV
jgi:glycosyltransferase involved in cell wall biosynthesis